MQTYEIKDADGTIHTMRAEDPITACERVADLHRVTVVAWRTPPTHLSPAHPDQIEG